MKTRILAALVALVVIPFAAFGADEENPFKKVKVGDYASYKFSFTTTFDGKVEKNDSGQLFTVTVTAKDDKEATVKSFTKMDGNESTDKVEKKIDLTKPFHPAMFLDLLKADGDEFSQGGVPVKMEKLKSGEEKLKFSGKEYVCRWESFKFPAGGKGFFGDADPEIKIWQSKEFALKIAKVSVLIVGEVGDGKSKIELILELTESGNKKKD